MRQVHAALPSAGEEGGTAEAQGHGAHLAPGAWGALAHGVSDRGMRKYGEQSRKREN